MLFGYLRNTFAATDGDKGDIIKLKNELKSRANDYEFPLNNDDKHKDKDVEDGKSDKKAILNVSDKDSPYALIDKYFPERESYFYQNRNKFLTEYYNYNIYALLAHQIQRH